LQRALEVPLPETIKLRLRNAVSAPQTGETPVAAGQTAATSATIDTPAGAMRPQAPAQPSPGRGRGT
jgi:hypothetical protein